ncbi:MAG: 4a-hydroxytetrahydrobiopterin dehydratase [Rudaea sp.]
MLRQEGCVACRSDSPQVTDQEIRQLTPQIPDWTIIEREGEKRLERVFKFHDFAEALAFTMRVGEEAEEQDHHPLLVTEWGKVTVDWWTHKIHGLHRNDFIMAAKTDQIYADMTDRGGAKPTELESEPLNRRAA